MQEQGAAEVGAELGLGARVPGRAGTVGHLVQPVQAGGRRGRIPGEHDLSGAVVVDDPEGRPAPVPVGPGLRLGLRVTRPRPGDLPLQRLHELLGAPGPISDATAAVQSLRADLVGLRAGGEQGLGHVRGVLVGQSGGQPPEVLDLGPAGDSPPQPLPHGCGDGARREGQGHELARPPPAQTGQRRDLEGGDGLGPSPPAVPRGGRELLGVRHVGAGQQFLARPGRELRGQVDPRLLEPSRQHLERLDPVEAGIGGQARGSLEARLCRREQLVRGGHRQPPRAVLRPVVRVLLHGLRRHRHSPPR